MAKHLQQMKYALNKHCLSALIAATWPAIMATAATATIATTACGGGEVGLRGLTPTLPADGDSNTAAPTLPGDDVASSPGLTLGAGSRDTGQTADRAGATERAQSDPWAGRTDLIAAPAAQAPRAIELANIQRFRLPNGLQVIAVPRSDVPVVNVVMSVQAGAADAPRDRMGVASFVASMLLKGTQSRNARTIASTIELVGGSLNAGATFETSEVTCRALARDLGTCLTLIADVTVRPTFPNREMDQVRKQLLASVRQRRDNAGALANAHFDNLLWGDEHVRGWPVSDRTLNAIQRADLLAWHRRWFAPQNATLLIAGDINARTLRPRLTQAFRQWRRRPIGKRTTYQDPTLTQPLVRLIDKPGQTQTHIRLGHFGIAHTDPAYFDLSVVNYILGGGGFSSRLMQVVRAQAGKTYGASSRFDRDRTRGALLATTFTRNAEAVATAQLLMQEWQRMKRDGPSADEVADAITSIAGRYALSFQSVAAIGRAILTAQLHGLDLDYVRNVPLKVAEVNTESAERAANQLLHTDHYALVFVGDAAELEPQLQSAGWEYEKVHYLAPVAGYERQGNAAAAAAAAPSDDAQAAGRALLERAIAAKGGLERLRQISFIQFTGTGTIQAGPQQLATRLTRFHQPPDKMRIDLEISFGGNTTPVTTVLNGEAAWNRQAPNGLSDLPPNAVGELKKQLWHDPDMVLLRALDAAVQLSRLAPETRDGKRYDVLQIVSPDNVLIKLYLDPRTRLARFAVYSSGGGGETSEIYGDYRTVDGIQVAHSRRTKAPDAELAITLESVTFNKPPNGDIFTKPNQ